MLNSKEYVLVAGGSGFVGRPLCDSITDMGFNVIDYSIEPIKSNKYLTIKGDITNQSQLEEIIKFYPIKKIINLATLLHTDSINNPIKATNVGVEGTLNLLELGKKANIDRFIYASSTCVLKPKADMNISLDESSPVVSTDIYGEIKRFVEALGVYSSSIYKFEFISARISLVIGPGKPSKTSSYRMEMFNRLKDGGVVYIPYKPNVVLPLSHYCDVSDATIRLMIAKKLKYSIYHIPCESWKMSDLSRVIEEIGNGVTVKFGDRDFQGGVPYINCERIKKELSAEVLPLKNRLLDYKNFLSKKDI